jgi:uncharacterized protein YifN (PemK superfamily)
MSTAIRKPNDTITVHRPTISVRNGRTSAPVPANDQPLKATIQRGALTHWDSSKLTIKRKPKPREVYFIAAPSGAREPEFTGYHPGVILTVSPVFSEAAGSVVFVPLTTDAPKRGFDVNMPSYVHRLSAAPGPEPDRKVFAVCDHLITASVCRLERFFYPGEGLKVPEVSKRDFEAILDCVHSAIVPLRNRAEERMRSDFERRLSELQCAHEGEIADLRSEHARSLAAREDELLEILTAPEFCDRAR